MNFIERVINFFREDVGEIVGVYFDGEKIFFAHLTDEVETEKINFQIADEENFSPIEQLAEKISVTCAKNGWKTSRLGICLRNDEVIFEQRYFENIPEDELNDAIKSWSKAAGGGYKSSLYLSSGRRRNLARNLTGRQSRRIYFGLRKKFADSLRTYRHAGFFDDTGFFGERFRRRGQSKIYRRSRFRKKISEPFGGKNRDVGLEKIFKGRGDIFFNRARNFFGEIVSRLADGDGKF